MVEEGLEFLIAITDYLLPKSGNYRLWIGTEHYIFVTEQYSVYMYVDCKIWNLVYLSVIVVVLWPYVKVRRCFEIRTEKLHYLLSYIVTVVDETVILQQHQQEEKSVREEWQTECKFAKFKENIF